MYEVKVFGIAGPGDYLRVILSDYAYATFKQDFDEYRQPVIEVEAEDGDILSFATRYISVVVGQKLTSKKAHETAVS